MKRITLIVGMLILVAVLAGAAFVGAKMLTTSQAAETAAASSGGERVLSIVNDDGSGPVALNITFEPAPELPDRPAEGGGIFVRREDNSYFVGTGEIELDVEIDASGKETISTNHSGPVLEAVINHDTLIYRDETALDIDSSARESGEISIQQVVKPTDSLTEVSEGTELQVWGRRSGDRIIAEVLVYRQARF